MKTKWKYLVIEVKGPAFAQEPIDKHGAEGWELVSVVPVLNSEGLTIFLKRPETDFENRPQESALIHHLPQQLTEEEWAKETGTGDT